VDRTEAKRRRWADVAVIIVAVITVLLAFFTPQGAAPATAAEVVLDQQLWWWSHALGGALAVAAVLVAQRNRGFGRLLLAGAGIALLAGLYGFTRIGLGALLLQIAPALVFFASIPFLGRMPAPEEEGIRR
jgi:hypothetical protein